jgi:hypothetical protein
MTFDEFRLVAAHQTINLDAAVLEYEGTGRWRSFQRISLASFGTILRQLWASKSPWKGDRERFLVS